MHFIDTQNINHILFAVQARYMTKKRRGPAHKRAATTDLRTISWHTIFVSKWIIPLCIVFVFGILLATRQIADPDIGFHLRGGQWMIENMKFHSYDVFTYTVNGNEYIALYWLYQIILYGIFSLSSYIGLTIFNVLLLAVIFFLVFLRMKSARVPLGFATFSLFTTILAIEFRFLYRPEIITWCMLLLMLIVLDQYHSRRRNLLYLLPVMQLIWVNSHGLFILGWIIIAAYFISVWVHEKCFDTRLFKWFAASLAASFINPYFFRGIAFPFYLYTRLHSSNIFNPMISEFQSPWIMKTMGTNSLFLTAPLHWYYLISVISLILLLVTYRKRRLHEYLLWAAFFYLSATVVRNVPLFIFVAIQLVAISLRDIFPGIRSRIEQTRISFKILHPIPQIFSVFVILLGLRVVTNAYYLDDNRAINFGAGLDRHAHPIVAADFLKQNRLAARLLNDLNSGSWFIWQLPQPVFIDGRLEVMKESFFSEYLRSFTESGLESLITKYRPQLIVFDHAAALNWTRQLTEMNDWHILHLDEKSVVYGHNSYAPSELYLDFPNWLAHRGLDATISDSEVWNILKKETPSKVTGFLEGFTKQRNYGSMLPLNLALFAYGIGESRTAEILFLDIMRNSVYYSYEVHFNLGAVYYRRGDYEKALYCYDRVLQMDRDNAYAKKYISSIKRLIREQQY